MMEINPRHPIVLKLYSAQNRDSADALAALVAEQMFDNCLIAAGLVDDPRTMLARMNKILAASMSAAEKP